MEGPTTTAKSWCILLLLHSLLLYSATASAGGEMIVKPPPYIVYVRNEGGVNGHRVSFSCTFNTSYAGVEWTRDFSLDPGPQFFAPWWSYGYERFQVARMTMRALYPGETATLDCAYDAGDGCRDRFVLFDSRSASLRACARRGCLFTVRDAYLKVRPLCPGSVKSWRFWQAASGQDEFWYTNYRSLPYAVPLPPPSPSPSPSPSHRYHPTARTLCAKKRFQPSNTTGHSYEQGCISRLEESPEAEAEEEMAMFLAYV